MSQWEQQFPASEYRVEAATVKQPLIGLVGSNPAPAPMFLR